MEKIMHRCPLCNSLYQQGPGRYEGHISRRYQLEVCDVCWKGNWDGWNPRHEGFLLLHLKEKGLEVPPRNANGYLPRE